MDVPDIVEQIRTAIRDSGLTLVELAKRCGVDQPRLSRFVRGERSLTLNSAAKVCAALRLRLSAEEPSAPAEGPELRAAEPPTRRKRRSE